MVFVHCTFQSGRMVTPVVRMLEARGCECLMWSATSWKWQAGDTILELTRHGKRVAGVKSPDAAASTPDLGNWIHSGGGTVACGPNHDPNTPAWEADDWAS